jgi:hypothetical protein
MNSKVSSRFHELAWVAGKKRGFTSQLKADLRLLAYDVPWRVLLETPATA